MSEKTSSLGDALFSKTQQQVLRLLFGQPERSFYANEIVRFAGMGIGAVQRELARLAEAGLVTVNKVGNQKHYQANHKAPIFEELCRIVSKTFGVSEVLRSALAPLASKITAAFIYGSIAKRTDTAASDIDLMLIGDGFSYTDVVACLEESESTIGRSVNPTIYSTDEWRHKRKEGAAFVRKVMEQPTIFLIGSQDDIGAS